MTIGREQFAERFSVSRETIAQLNIYEALLQKWNQRINLIASGTSDHIWERHFADSAQILAICPKNISKWTDLGSGAGFPGAVIAILSMASHPGMVTTLIESDQRKATFLRAVSRETGAKFRVLDDRIEAAERQASNIVTARAVAPLPQLLGLVALHLSDDGTALLSKGATAVSEVEMARKTWSFSCESIQSVTDPSAAILKIGEIARV